MATSGVGNRFQQHVLQISLAIATYIILSGMSDVSASVQRTEFEIMSLLTSNPPGVFTTYIEHSAIPTATQWMPNPCHAMFTEDSTCFDIFSGSGVTSRIPTSSIQCRWACLTTSRSGCPLHEDVRMARQVQCNMFIYACFPRPHTKHEGLWGTFQMQWEGDEKNEPVHDWSCNPVSMRRKPRSASHIHLRNWVHTGIVSILYVCSI